MSVKAPVLGGANKALYPTLVLLALFAGTPGHAANEEAVRDFGVERSDPIDLGFYFHRGKYIEAPYVIKRRGLDIYLNNILVKKGPEWPPYDYDVPNDPGGPPPGVSPFNPNPDRLDHRDTYWSRKWRHLIQHHEHGEAKRLFVKALAESEGIKDVVWSDRSPDMAIVVGPDGARVGYAMPSRRRLKSALWATDRETVLKWAQGKTAYWKQLLNANVLICEPTEGTSLFAGGEKVAVILEILLSNQSDEEKIRLLEAQYFLTPGLKSERLVVTAFTATPQLAKRYQQHVERRKERERQGEVAAALRGIAQIAEAQGIITDPAAMKPEPYTYDGDSVRQTPSLPGSLTYSPEVGASDISVRGWLTVIGGTLLFGVLAATLLLLRRRRRRTAD